MTHASRITHHACRLFCFPYAGAGAAVFSSWQPFLSPAIQVRAVELPGRGTQIRQPPFRNLLSLVAELAEVLSPALVAPFAFFGHSLGALLAFELARTVRSAGVAPIRLFVSAAGAPHLPPAREPIAALPDAEFLEAVRRFDGLPDELMETRELLEVFLPVLRADFAMAETYAYREAAPLDCPITVFGGAGDRTVEQGALESWRFQTNRESKLRLLQGGHFFLQQSKLPLLAAITGDLKMTMGWQFGSESSSSSES